MPNERASELMYDTASTLRLLAAELGELAPRRSADTLPAPPTASAAHEAVSSAIDDVPARLSTLFERAMDDVHALLPAIRKGHATVQTATAQRLSHSSDKLDEVSSATESAAIDIMHALERAIARVDELETDDVRADPTRSRAIRVDLREDLFAVMGHMQFQDITSQQIMHVQSMLAEMEGRLAEIAERFQLAVRIAADLRVSETIPVPGPPTASAAFDPNASLANAETRQALADSLVNRGSGSV